MKNRFLLLIVILFTVFATTVSAYSSELSYGISVLRNGVNMRKCSLSGEPCEFSPSDFESALGVKHISAICINSLPERSLGALTLCGKNVRKGQIISRAAVSELVFTPSSGNPSVVEFTFSDASDTSSIYTCTINLTETAKDVAAGGF